MISIIIVTRNRREKLHTCVQSLRKNTHTKFQVIVVDQSDDKAEIRNSLRAFHDSRVKYYPQHCRNVSKGKNLGIKMAVGDIIAFTDDDCVVRTSWVDEINKFYRTHKHISCMFGRTLPYKPRNHTDEFCPSVFDKINYREINTPTTHWDNIGVGNNMSFRSSIFCSAGLFKEWLGYGTAGGPSEDAELALRLVLRAYTVAYNPNAVVYHDNWVSTNVKMKLQSMYYLGNIVCYGYFSFQNRSFANSVLRNEITGYIFDNAHNGRANHFTDYLVKLCLFLYRTLVVISKLSLSFYLSRIDPIV